MALRPLRLADAMAAADENPDEPVPISAGRCEHPSGTVLCGERGRWWYRRKFLCTPHKNATIERERKAGHGA